MPASQPASRSGPPAPRTCGRCRGVFPGVLDVAFGQETGWWACGPCRGRLFGPGGQPADWRAAAALVQAGR